MYKFLKITVSTVCRLQNERSHLDWVEALPRCHHSGGSGSGGVCSLRHPAVAPAGRWRHRGRYRAPGARSSRPEAAASGGSLPELQGHRQSQHARQLREERDKECVRAWQNCTHTDCFRLFCCCPQSPMFPNKCKVKKSDSNTTCLEDYSSAKICQTVKL